MATFNFDGGQKITGSYFADEININSKNKSEGIFFFSSEIENELKGLNFSDLEVGLIKRIALNELTDKSTIKEVYIRLVSTIKTLGETVRTYPGLVLLFDHFKGLIG